MKIRKVAVVGGARVPFARSMGKYLHVSPQQLMTESVNHLCEKYSLADKPIDEFVSGAVIKHSSEWNLSREVVLNSPLSPRTVAYDITQACGTSLEATLLIANKIALGQIEAGIAGGCDTNSDLPIVFSQKFRNALLNSYRAKGKMNKLKPFFTLSAKDFFPVLPGILEPQTGLSMGQSCELMAQKWNIARKDQDELAYSSHQKAAKAYEEGFFKDLVFPCKGMIADNNVRAETSLEKLATLRPVFERSEKGSLTAGNSTPLTDGSSAVLLTSEDYAKKYQLPVQAYFSWSQCAAVDFVKDEGLLMAPAYAVPKLLKQAQLSLQDFDYYEIHEAFAAQVLCTLKAWEDEKFCKEKLGLEKALGSIDRSKLNVKGGSLALGHPFAATGARIVASLAKILSQNPKGRGLISICTAGGMGVTAIMEGCDVNHA